VNDEVGEKTTIKKLAKNKNIVMKRMNMKFNRKQSQEE
jgi:hypothetical protein